MITSRRSSCAIFKANNERRLPDRAFSFTFGEDGKVTVERDDPGTIPDEQPMNQADRISHELLRGALSANDLAERLEITPATVRAALSTMHTAGKVTRIENRRDGKWGLVAQHLT